MHSKTDSVQSSAEALRYPWENHPGHDQVVEVTPGVLWARLKLPFRLNHVNIYLLADGDGWTMVDAGFGNEESIAAWTTLFEGPLKGVNVTRLIVTHSHPDHVLSKISPNVSVWAVEPEQNSLGEYLFSLASLTTTLPYDVMVLPGHGVPFYGLKTRIKQLADHHEDRCRLIADACRDTPKTSKELVPVVFHKHT